TGVARRRATVRAPPPRPDFPRLPPPRRPPLGRPLPFPPNRSVMLLILPATPAVMHQRALPPSRPDFPRLPPPRRPPLGRPLPFPPNRSVMLLILPATPAVMHQRALPVSRHAGATFPRFRRRCPSSMHAPADCSKWLVPNIAGRRT